ncbi:ATP-binding cassette domain-containing protein [bacterium]|nr:ATP-binding cassette domain-containing protein [bacterium]
MIEVKGISKSYGPTLAVDNVSFEVHRGEIVGFLGPNGAGKSTSMKVITGYLAPDRGTVSIDGNDILEAPIAARSRLGYLPESTPLYEDMGVLDYLDFMGRMHNVPAERRRGRIDELVDICDLGRMAHKDIGELSKGYRQRVGLAQALVSDPPVLVLDEPTSGLDPAQIVEIRALIREIAREKAILLSTHILPEAQNVCDRILIISQGRLVGEGTPGELLSMAAGGEQYTVTFKGRAGAELRGALERLPRVSDVSLLSEEGGSRFRLKAEGGADLNEKLFDLAVSQGAKLLELNKTATTLESVFLQLTGTSASGDALHSVQGHDAPAAAEQQSGAAAAEQAKEAGDE